ncbi:MAG: Beta-galactosidase/beta-glucuronidase [Bacteroidetes bacterium]|nr:Beta-galactosidase/beta-glucuronidase [Bacteroidota bacterium]
MRTRHTTFALTAFTFGLTTSLLGQPATLAPTLQLRTLDGVTVPYQNGMPMPGFEKQRRTTISLNGPWRSKRFAASDGVSLTRRDSAGYAAVIAEASGRHTVSYDDAAWSVKSLPAVENQLLGYEKCPEFYEDGVWYRRSFDVPDSLAGSRVMLMFYAANYVADVWLNDRYIGYHEGGYTSFAFDITDRISYDTTNVLAVRVDNPAWGTRMDIVPYQRCDWFNYTGIVHEVYLEFSARKAVARAEVVPLDTLGTLQVTTTVVNTGASADDMDVELIVHRAEWDATTIGSELPADIAGPAVAVSGQASTVIAVPADSAGAWRTTVSVADPRIWSPWTPNLYVLEVVLRSGGTVVDRFHTQFGIRTVSTSGPKLYLNGKITFLSGVARHEDHPDYGRSVPPAVILSDMQVVKGLNASFLRTAHYPNHPFTYSAADRVGLMIKEEIPMWWFDDAAAWTYQNVLRKIHYQMWREMVFRDRNRPSIILWSTSNENKDVTNRTAYNLALNTELDTQYPDGRLVTQSAAADRPGPYDPSQANCDVAGWTMYFGVFHGSTYYEGTKQFLEDAHASYPDKPVLNTEMGVWGEGPDQIILFDSTFAALAEASQMNPDGTENPDGFVAGATWWTAFDWYTHLAPKSYQYMGLIHMNRSTEKSSAARVREVYQPYYASAGILNDVAERDRTSPPVGMPAAFSLEQNYPNPFNPETRIRYSVPARSGAGNDAGAAVDGTVRLAVYDLLGREVAVLVDERKAAGSHEAAFNAASLASGVYLYRLTAGPFVASKRMLVIK